MASEPRIPVEIDDSLTDFLREVLAYLDGEMSAEEVAVFDEALANDPERRQVFVRFCYNARLIRESLSDRIVSEDPETGFQIPDQDIMLRLLEEAEQNKRAALERAANQQLEREQEKSAASERQQTLSLMLGLAGKDGKVVRHYVIPKWAVYGAVAALVAIGFFIIDSLIERDGTVQNQQQPNLVEVPQSVMVAKIVEAVDAKWEDASIATAAGTELASGPYRLKSGLVKLKFNDGAELIVEAPTSLTLESVGGVRLETGRVTGLCPPKARGFVVRTTWGRVVDLGTEFGVFTNEEGMTDVEVFNGKVSVVADKDEKAANTWDLAAGKAARLTNAGKMLSRHDAKRHSFIRFGEFIHWVRAAQGSSYDRWHKLRFELMRREDVLAYLPFEKAPGDSRIIRNLIEDSNVGNAIVTSTPKWTQGLFENTQALRVDSNDDHIRMNIPGEYEQLSMAMWVKIDSFKNGISGLVMSDGALKGTNFAHWQFNNGGGFQFASAMSEGIRPNIRPNTKYELLDTEKDTGRWVHLAVVYDRPNGVVYFYRDGEAIQTMVAERFAPIELGMVEIGNWNVQGSHSGLDVRHMVGDIAELVVFNAAVSANDIRTIYLAGRPE